MPKFFENALNSGKRAGQKAKLKAENIMLDRNIIKRKKSFGVYMYDVLFEYTTEQDFYATNDETVSIVRPVLLEADREIRALDGKNLVAKGDLEVAQAKRAEAFPAPANNWKEKAKNGAKGAGFAAGEAKIKTKMAVNNGKKRSIKEEFGVKLFNQMEEYFPGGESAIVPIDVHCTTDNIVNEIRSGFQACKSDIIDISRKRMSNEQEIKQLSVEGSLRRLS
mmetsp:Transcript_26244/g.40124  ORF Transcript_26244/g.40124 Transcript_26244/m.40124 type:complete len:222 (-) Transcript_26244:1495-2160(-)